jgi:hypothetical protein
MVSYFISNIYKVNANNQMIKQTTTIHARPHLSIQRKVFEVEN